VQIGCVARRHRVDCLGAASPPEYAAGLVTLAGSLADEVLCCARACADLCARRKHREVLHFLSAHHSSFTGLQRQLFPSLLRDEPTRGRRILQQLTISGIPNRLRRIGSLPSYSHSHPGRLEPRQRQGVRCRPGEIGPCTGAVLAQESMNGVPPQALPVRTAALYAALLYEALAGKLTVENANVLWHLLNGYQASVFDSRAEVEICAAVAMVTGKPLLTSVLAVVNKKYRAQAHLQWRKCQHVYACAMERAAVASSTADDHGAPGQQAAAGSGGVMRSQQADEAMRMIGQQQGQQRRQTQLQAVSGAAGAAPAAAAALRRPRRDSVFTWTRSSANFCADKMWPSLSCDRRTPR
jgi:hypothetical protein